MKIDTITPPASLPVTYAQARHHLRLDDDGEQGTIEGYIQAATDHAENYLQRSLITRTLRVTYGPDEAIILPFYLPRGPVQSITAATDDQGNALDVADYAIHRQGTRDYLWTSGGGTPHSVTYVAGYGDREAIPAGIKTAILMTVATLHRTRESHGDRRQYEAGIGLANLLGPYVAGGVI